MKMRSIYWGDISHDIATWTNLSKFLKHQTYRNCVFDKTLCNKAISDLWQVGGFLLVLWVPSPIKLKYC